MKVCVFTDVHDNTQNLKKVLQNAQESGAKALIFLGDFCAPPVFRLIAETKLPFYFIFGNVDGEQVVITREATKMQHVTFDRDLLEFELDKRKIAICHRPQFAEGLAATGKYDAVFHGHSHEPRVLKVGKTLLANPGEVVGSVSGLSFGIYDTSENEIEIVKM
jgi:putative phosphoesterase